MLLPPAKLAVLNSVGKQSHSARLAYEYAEAIARRRRLGQPIPRAMQETLDAANRYLSKVGHPAGETSVELSRLKTQRQLADEFGCCTRTVRRRAEALGWRKFNGYILDQEGERP